MVKFIGNPNCCPKCEELDGKLFPDDTNIFDVSHPRCRCWFEFVDDPQKPVVPVKKLIEVSEAVFDPEETEKDVEGGANPADPRTAKRAGATFKAIKESYMPMLILDDTEKAEDEREKRLREEAKRNKDNMSVQNCDHCKNDLETQAINDTLQEEFYTGFQYTNQPSGDIPTGTVATTYDYGSTLVQISPVGDFFGTGPDGKPVPESVTIESLQNLVKNIDGEILVDFDHASENTNDTRAAAWASDFVVVENLGNSSGLYGRLKWTREGRQAAQERKYRFLSPVWDLDDENHPIKLQSIALTNKPALKGISPIINSEPKEPKQENEIILRNNTMDNEILEIVGISPLDPEKGVSEEEKARVLETIKGWKDFTEKAEAERKAKELRDAFDETVKDYEIDDVETMFAVYQENPELFKKTLNACGKKSANACDETEAAKDVAKNSDQEQPKEDEKADPTPDKTPEEEKPEVIPVEVLNSAPAAMPKSAKEKAMDLHGEAFFDYIKKHESEIREC